MLVLVLASVAVLEVREHDSFVGWGGGGDDNDNIP